MNHDFLFYSALPRSGGTMLASVLNQHPELYVSSLSPTIKNRNLNVEEILGRKIIEQYSGFEYWRQRPKNKYKVFGI